MCVDAHLEVLGRPHHDLPKPWNPKSYIRSAVVREMEGVESHLSRWLSDRLHRDGPHRFPRGGQTLHVFGLHQELDRLPRRPGGCNRCRLGGDLERFWTRRLLKARGAGVEECLQGGLKRFAHAAVGINPRGKRENKTKLWDFNMGGVSQLYGAIAYSKTKFYSR